MERIKIFLNCTCIWSRKTTIELNGQHNFLQVSLSISIGKCVTLELLQINQSKHCQKEDKQQISATRLDIENLARN